MENQTLHNYLASSGTIPLERAIEMITPVLHHLAVLHKKGIVNGEIVPDNLIIDEKGLLKLVDPDVSHRAYDKSNVFTIVYPGYAPPEQYSFHNTGPKIDVYAVGAVLYLMLTGRRLPESIERMIALNKGMDTLVEPISKYCQITPQQEQAIFRAIHLNHRRRTPTAEQFLKELTEVHHERSKSFLRKVIARLINHL